MMAGVVDAVLRQSIHVAVVVGWLSCTVLTERLWVGLATALECMSGREARHDLVAYHQHRAVVAKQEQPLFLCHNRFPVHVY